MGKHWSDRLVAIRRVQCNCDDCRDNGIGAKLCYDPKNKSCYYVMCWNADCGRMTGACKTMEQAVSEWEKRNTKLNSRITCSKCKNYKDGVCLDTDEETFNDDWCTSYIRSL